MLLAPRKTALCAELSNNTNVNVILIDLIVFIIRNGLAETKMSVNALHFGRHRDCCSGKKQHHSRLLACDNNFTTRKS